MQDINEISMTSVVYKNPHIPTTDLDDEVAMFNVETGKYYAIGIVGSRIWRLMDEPRSAGSIIEILTMEYEVETETCKEQVFEFLNELNQAGLLSIAG